MDLTVVKRNQETATESPAGFQNMSCCCPEAGGLSPERVCSALSLTLRTARLCLLTLPISLLCSGGRGPLPGARVQRALTGALTRPLHREALPPDSARLSALLFSSAPVKLKIFFAPLWFL